MNQAQYEQLTAGGLCSDGHEWCCCLAEPDECSCPRDGQSASCQVHGL